MPHSYGRSASTDGGGCRSARSNYGHGQGRFACESRRPASASRQRPSSAPRKGGGPHKSIPSACGSGAAAVANLARGHHRPTASDSYGSERVKQVLQEQSLELKATGNNLHEDTTKCRTRFMGLEKELVKREKVLRQLAALNKAGHGIGMDLIEKLKEERNMLPIYKRKVAALQAEVDEKDAEIREMKRDPQFTKIIELQVEFASWQHESQRLARLLEDPGLETCPAAKEEVESHRKRVEKLEKEHTVAEKELSKAQEELHEAEQEHAEQLGQYQEKEEEFARNQDQARKVLNSYQEHMQQRKHLEQLESAIEALHLDKKKLAEELSGLQDEIRAAKVPANPPLARGAITKGVWSGTLPGSVATSSSSSSSPRTKIQRAMVRPGSSPLLAEFLKRDTAACGLITRDQFYEALGVLGVSLEPKELESLHSELSKLSATRAATSPPSGEVKVRWLDFLVCLARIGPPQGSYSDALPSLGSLRGACFRKKVTCEELRRQLLQPGQCEAFFRGLDLGQAEQRAWLELCTSRGPDFLLLRIPLSEVALTESALRGWQNRVASAVRLHRQELEEAFSSWQDSVAPTSEDFESVCMGSLALELSIDDIRDLALEATQAGGKVDGKILLAHGS